MKIKRIHLYRKDILFYIFVVLFLLSIFTGSSKYRIFSYSAEIVSLLALWSFLLTKSRQRGFYVGFDRTLLILFVCQIIFIWIAYFTYSYYPYKTLTFAIRHLLLLPIFYVSISSDYVERILKVSRVYISIASIIYIVLYPAMGNNGSIFGSYQHVATYSCILIIGILAKLFSYNSFSKEDYIQLGISTFVLFMTGKRSFVIIIIVITLIGILFLKNNKKYKRFTQLFIFGIVFGGLVLLLKPELLESLTRFKGLGDSDSTMSGRINLWNLAIYLWMTNPILGIGYGTFSTFTGENLNFTFSSFGVQRTFAAHNIYMQLLAETGIIGTVIFITFFIVALLKTIRVLKSTPEVNYRNRLVVTISLFLQLWFLLYGLSGNDLYVPGQLMLYLFAVSVNWSKEKG